ncbi:MAG: PilZ domain-containing protein [Treponema sp.]|jgi:hypothetical protein|nr:PilZ domain-containing protein [Treponema sp.]
MFEHRKHIRYKTIALARLPDIFEGETFLKSLSITGCSIEATVFIGLTQGVVYTIEIIPEAASKISKFEIHGEVRWIHIQEDSYEAGFMITASPPKKEFRRYVDYLAWRSSSVQ